MIEVKQLNVSYGQNMILHNVNFQMEQGKIYVLLGENGSGKTTLMKAMLGLCEAKGEIFADGRSCSEMANRERAQVFGYVPQIKSAIDHVTVTDFLETGAVSRMSLLAQPSRTLKQEIKAVLKQFQFTYLEHAYLDEISGGELQMVYVMRAFLQHPACYILDEPCTYLDYRNQHHFFAHLAKLCMTGACVFVSLHDPNLALQYADEILMMRNHTIEEIIIKTEPDFETHFLQVYQKQYPQVRLYQQQTHAWIVWEGEEYVEYQTLCKSDIT